VGDDGWWERYEGVRRRVTALVSDDEAVLRATVPACPAWTGKDLLAHLVGLAEDIAAGRIDGYASEAWTSEQVGRGASRSVGVLLEAWPVAACAIRDSDVGGVPAAALAFGDAIVHEADLVAVTRRDHAVPEEDVAVAVKTGVARWRQVLAAGSTPTLHIVVPGHRDWWLGDRDRAPVTTLEVDQQVLFRTLYGRRSLDQARALAWSPGPEPFVENLPYPFHWADSDLDA
jgi:hypothetical protein